jgi:Abnormal spindle-like microcephaly-assoc'd, ASPM-SPD-2-Hydin/Beta-propeller repeat
MNNLPPSRCIARNTLLALLSFTCMLSSSSFAQSGTAVSGPVPQATGKSIPPAREAMRKSLLRQPLHFEPGLDGSLSSRSMGRALQIDRGGAVQFGERGNSAVSIRLEGANPDAKPAGQDQLPGHSNYLLGNDPAKWRREVSQFSRVQVASVYPGIDLIYYGNGDELEHDYVVAPNADPGQIQMQFRGATPRLDAQTGELVLQQPAGLEAAIRLERPVAYQLSEDGTRRSVAASFRLRADGEAQFTLGNYDHARPLVIDPVILYGTYFGGDYNDSIIDIKVASDGSLYLLLTTDSTDLKTVGATNGACIGKCGPANADLGNSSQPDMYIAKLDSNAQTLLFATYLGGSDSDQAFNLALDTDGSIYVSGTSNSADFPVVNGYPGGTPVSGGSAAGTLTKLSADGSTILYSTFIGYGLPFAESPTLVGNGAAHAMVTANNGIVYLIGQAGSTDGDFLWQKNPLFTVGADFVAKLDTTKTGTDSVVYATRVGDSDNSSSNAQVTAVAIDTKGDVWLYGETKNSAFPATTTGALQPQCTTPASSSCLSSFLMELDPTGTSVLYATYLGGSGGSNVTSFDIQLDASDTIYVSGYTDQANFPILNGAYPTLPSSASNYISKISSDGKTLLYSTFVQSDIFAVSSDGKLAFTISSGPGFPLKDNLQTTAPTGSNLDAAFGFFDTTLSGTNSLLISSYLGTNTGSTQPWRVYLASSGQILIMGETSATDLPVANAYQPASGGGVYDGFLAIVQANDTLTLTPATLTFPSTSVGSTSAPMTATLYNGTTKSVYLKQPTLTDSTDFTQSDNCNGILSPQASCTVTFTFTPQSAGTLTSTYTTGDLDNPSSPLTVVLNGTATGSTGQPKPQLTPATINFGSVAVGATSAPQTAMLKNAGTASLTITSFGFFGTNPSSFQETNTCGSSLAAGASCTISLTCAPAISGSLTANLGANFPSPIVQQSIALTCTGTGSAQSETLTPASIDFGTVIVGQTGTQTITYQNKGPAAATIYNYSNTNPAFSVIGSTCTPNVAANASCTYTLQFAPTASGPQSSTFEVLDRSSNPTAALTGTTYISSPQITLTPNPLNFQNIPEGQSTDLLVTLTNSSSFTITLPEDKVDLEGPSGVFSWQNAPFAGYCNFATSPTVVLAPGASCNLDIFFDADSIPVDTSATGSLTLAYTLPGSSTLYAVTGEITANTISPATPIVTPTNIQFPATANGKTSSAQIVNVSNTGEQPLSFTGATFTGANPTAFAQTNNCPATLNKNDACKISVTFTPGATGNEFTATLNVGLSTGLTTVTLTGGTSPSDFILSTTTPSQSNPSATWTLNIAPLTASIGFNEPITFTVTGLDPSYGTPVFTPSTVTPKGATVTTKLTLDQSPTAQLRRDSRSAIPVLACCMAFLLSFRKRLKSYRSRVVAMIVVLALAVFALSGCAKSPVNFTVTATSGSISHDLTLTLQP